ncbi:CGNR zinc finger domain-containing protein [Nocardioides panaciterrulae]|uniref:Putative RNA-binding Zn ribbon-like protein n=1 Tax=Nocardioides panaciterrulae TaxID=661492 RepID=A0A7Y9JCF0_9ACTN|nr:putative RNA-binding Zn ribbon-like protein [Nocardioides panaciterrulae]
MLFDSHVLALMEVAVGLVNLTTGGEDRGTPYDVPSDPILTAPVSTLLARGGRRPRVSVHDVEVLRRTAERARVVFESVADGDVPRAAEVVNLLLRETGARPQLDRFDDGAWSLHFHGLDDSLAHGWAAGVAAGLALAVGSELAGRLGVCAAPGCDRVYVDTSRNSQRRFCSTRCQSRVKAAVHRSRHR